MSTRQYIGARYTPKFSGTYDATQAYEALEVVDNGSGTTYIARKPVPPNTPLTNTEYWLVYGSSSGAILDLQSRVNNIENTDIPAINQDISNINGSILTMGGQISELESEITDISIPFSYSDNDSVIVIGDSWTTGLHGNNKGFAYWFNTLIPHNNYYSKAENGAGFVTTGSSGNNFLALLTLLNGTLTDQAEIKHVIVLGGVNDQGASGISDAIATFKTYVAQNFPNATLDIVITNRMQNGEINASRYGYINAYITAVDNNTRVFNMIHDIPNDWHNTSHLTETGYEKMAKIVADRILGGNASTGFDSKTVTATMDLDNTKRITLTCREIDGYKTINISATALSGSFTITGLLKNILFNLSEDIDVPYSTYYPITMSLVSGGNRYSALGIVFFDTNKKMYIQTVLDSSITNFTDIYIQASTLNIGKFY